MILAAQTPPFGGQTISSLQMLDFVSPLHPGEPSLGPQTPERERDPCTRRAAAGHGGLTYVTGVYGLSCTRGSRQSLTSKNWKEKKSLHN